MTLRRNSDLHGRFPVGKPVVLHESRRTRVGLTVVGVWFAAAGVVMLVTGGYPILAAIGGLALGVATLVMRRFFQGGLWLRLDDDAMTFARPPFWTTLVVRWEAIASFSVYPGPISLCSFVLRDRSLAGTRSRWWRLLPGLNLLPTQYAGATSRELAAYLEAWRRHASRGTSVL